MKFRFEWTIPNLLSLVRIALIPLFAWLYLSDYLWWSVAVLVLSGATDWFDGVIARKFNQISEAGKYLDPAADKLTQV
ncbi:MAG: CDP-alcohol phosphatidyltransferase family protein, partial [Ruminococcaceae bacterium]|nr:CDP-alcohol phosphatidyltransferase family protein [Oscillospiraceae bacterium]